MIDKEALIQDIVIEAEEQMDIKSLSQYFIDKQTEYFESFDSKDLLNYAKEYIHGFNIEDYELGDTA